MRILIIEDEFKTADYVSKGLRENGYIVDVAYDGQDGLYQVTQHPYDLVIADIMLPKMDGWKLIAEIRRLNLDIRIIFLTACGDVENKVRGLELGADDYLVKPFAFSELLARVRSSLRRGSVQAPEVLSIADLNVDLPRHKATRGNMRLNLTTKELKLLVLLMQHPGEVLSRTLIAELVWDIHFDSDTNIIDVAVRRLRQKIDDPFEKKLIHTVRGRGYVLEER